MISIVFVASGSKGNATLISDGETLIQIDMGVSLTTLKNGLQIMGKKLSDVEALFITHDHSDHIKGVPLLKGKIPIFATPCSLEKDEVFETIVPYEGINVGKLIVFPFSVSHDAPNPVNYLIIAGEQKLAYVTDTGLLDETALSLLKDCDYYLLESNHDLEMLYKSNRPMALKKRIHGDQGHLSNVDSALYAASLVGPKTKAIYLGHISEECNTPAKAVETYHRVFAEKNVDLQRISIVCTKQWEPVIGGDGQ